MTHSLTGNLLVASTLVTDPNYAGGVCLIMHQDENHTIGVMLNRPLKPTPEALLAMFGLNSGGPDRLRRQSPVSEDQPEMDPPSTELIVSPPAETIPQWSPWRMVHFGGPLSGPVVAIHQDIQYAEAETGCGIYVAAQKQHLENLLQQQSAPYRLIVGHLGWQTNEIGTEIDAGIWHVIPADADAVFSPASDMWPLLIRRATSSSLAKWIGVPDNVDACELN